MQSQRCAAAAALAIGVSVLLLCRRELRLQGSCRADLDPAWCILGNVCGLCSTVLWFAVLVPQILHNARRKSVEGLSYAWSVANLSASCVNLFFVLRQELPSFVLISAVYMPVLEYIIILQFVRYTTCWHHRRIAVLITAVFGFYALANVLAWSGLSEFACALEWVAILLWSIETIPQLWLNHERGSTEGQALGSVMIAWLGKTTDFVAMFLLTMPVQNILQTYFSTIMAYCNVAQYFLMLPPSQRCPGQAGAALALLMLTVCSVLLGVKLQAAWAVLGPSAAAAAIFGGYRISHRCRWPRGGSELAGAEVCLSPALEGREGARTD